MVSIAHTLACFITVASVCTSVHKAHDMVEALLRCDFDRLAMIIGTADYALLCVMYAGTRSTSRPERPELIDIHRSLPGATTIHLH